MKFFILPSVICTFMSQWLITKTVFVTLTTEVHLEEDISFLPIFSVLCLHLWCQASVVGQLGEESEALLRLPPVLFVPADTSLFRLPLCSLLGPPLSFSVLRVHGCPNTSPLLFPSMSLWYFFSPLPTSAWQPLWTLAFFPERRKMRIKKMTSVHHSTRL